MKIEESEFWQVLSKLSLTERDYAFNIFTTKIEEKLNCKIVDKPYTADVTLRLAKTIKR